VMDVVLKRFCYHPEGTLGVIELAGKKLFTIERPWLDNAQNVSCIPTGTYLTRWRESPRFGFTWELQDVPDRSYILIHAANYPSNVQGCIGLGEGLMGDKIAVSNSRKAVKTFESLTEGMQWRLLIENAPYAAL
jgi:hypothetical protein